MKDLKQTLIEISSRDLEQRKHWYSPAAEAYNQVRPRYPEALIRQVVEVAQLSSDSTILEVGCGPATATLSFTPLGCPMLCLEPNPDFYQQKQLLFAELRHAIDQNGGKIQLSYVSAFHIARPDPPSGFT